MDARSRARIREWIAELDGLEGHVEQAIDHQSTMDARTPEVADAIRLFHDTVRRSHGRVGAHLATFDDDGGRGLAETMSGVLGTAAGMLDRVRATTVARAIRDDLVAFTGISVGYEMLLTSALAVGDTGTARLAELALHDYARVIERANAVLSTATLAELQADAEITIANPEVQDAVASARARAREAA